MIHQRIQTYSVQRTRTGHKGVTLQVGGIVTRTEKNEALLPLERMFTHVAYDQFNKTVMDHETNFKHHPWENRFFLFGFQAGPKIGHVLQNQSLKPIIWPPSPGSLYKGGKMFY